MATHTIGVIAIALCTCAVELKKKRKTYYVKPSLQDSDVNGTVNGCLLLSICSKDKQWEGKLHTCSTFTRSPV